jgi:DNA repair protein RAD7
MHLSELRLKEIGQICDDFLEPIKSLGNNLTYLDISSPGEPDALSTEAFVSLMSVVCGNLIHLDLSGNVLLSDGFLYQGLKPFARKLAHLVLSDLPDLTDAGVAKFFDTWAKRQDEREEGRDVNPPLVSLDLSRCHELSGLALASVLQHSGGALENLSINGWKSTPQRILAMIGENAPKLQTLDIGWCREVDDWVLKEVMEHCKHIKDVKVWGCQRITEMCLRKVLRTQRLFKASELTYYIYSVVYHYKA